MRLLQVILSVFFAVLLSGCGVNSDLMFKTKDAEIITDDIPLTPDEAYRLAPDDKFVFSLYANDGKRIIDVVSGADGAESTGAQRLGMNVSIDYWVRPDGFAKLPLIGDVKLVGLTVLEAQNILAERYSKDYTNPYVQLEVTNRRVLVFPGNGGEAKVVPIHNNNTTLLEALALAGGITERGKAKAIKIMRNTSEGRKVYLVNLSRLEHLKYADMIVQANDYIYVEPSRQLTREVLVELAPVLTVISTTVFVMLAIIRLN